ncbi:MAG TPA: hypothetical protein VK933_14015 [Longimicrobiales bacterium]|nr:hypothetical protein [Longimicrobiales bacterium]
MNYERVRRQLPIAWLHLAVGAFGILLFLATGLFMDRRLDHLRGMADAPRALYRSAHIYILFSALLNVTLGGYVRVVRSRPGVILQLAGSFLMVGALALFAYGFFRETPLGDVERPMVRMGIVWSFWGALLHAIAGYAGHGPGAERDSTSFE